MQESAGYTARITRDQQILIIKPVSETMQYVAALGAALVLSRRRRRSTGPRISSSDAATSARSRSRASFARPIPIRARSSRRSSRSSTTRNTSTRSRRRSTSPNPVDDFMFDGRRGFCEHFASAFVLMLRAGGIPARDRHRVPGRHDQSARRLHDRAPVGRACVGGGADRRAMAALRPDGRGLAVAYRDRARRSAARRGHSIPRATRRATGSATCSSRGTRSTTTGAATWWGSTAIGSASLFRDWRARRDRALARRCSSWRWSSSRGARSSSAGSCGSAAARSARSCCGTTSTAGSRSAGLPRHPYEGPLDFAKRAAARWPQFAIAFSAIGESFAELRYGAVDVTRERDALVATLERAIEVLPRRAARTLAQRRRSARAARRSVRPRTARPW